MTPRAFLEWWIEQLAEWIPPRWRSRVSERHDTLTIELRRDSASAAAQIDGKTHDFGDLDLEQPERQHAALQAFIADLPRRPTHLDLRLAPGQYLKREIELPAAAEDNLRETMSFQVERLTPFTPEEVIYHCGVVSRDPVAKRLKAWLAVAPAATVSQVLAWFGDERPQPVRVPKSPPADDAPLTLRYVLSAERHPRLAWALVVLNFVLLGAALAVHWHNREQELAAFEGALTEVRRDAAEAAALVDAVDRLRTEALAMRERRTGQPALVTVLDDLSVRLDDNTYLQRFEVRDGQLRLFGISAAASNLISQLEDSPLLADVRFESSVTRDAATGGERFSIAARLVAPESAAAGAEKDS